MYCIQHCFVCRPSDSTVSEDAGIKPKIVATMELAVRRSNHSAKSHSCIIVWPPQGLQGDVVYLFWPIASSYTESKCGGRGGDCGVSVSANENSCAHHVTMKPKYVNFGDLPPYLTYEHPWPRYTPGPGCSERYDFRPTAQELADIDELFGKDLDIPYNFEQSVLAYRPTGTRPNFSQVKWKSFFHVLEQFKLRILGLSSVADPWHLVWIQIRIQGSMPLTNRPGSPGSSYFRQWPSRRQQKTKFKKKNMLITFWRYINIIFQR